MKIFRAIFSLMMLGMLAAYSPAWAEAGDKAPEEGEALFSVPQQAAIEAIIHRYLVEKNPEVLVEATQTLQRQQEEELLAGVQSEVRTRANDLFYSNSPTMGNPEGNVAMVEFFDYQCIYCKRVSPAIADLIQQDNDVLFIFKEFPIFGFESEFASRATLAAQEQGKYFELHQALMEEEDRLTEEAILEAARGVGLNIKRLQRDMERPEIQAAIDANIMLANALSVMGTPAFIIASLPANDTMQVRFIPGEASLSELQKAIAEVREAG